MAQASRRTGGFSGSALVRLLSRLTDGVEGGEPRQQQTTADRLSQWFGWTDAIALSAALNGGRKAATTAPSGARAAAGAHKEEDECSRLRAALANAIAADHASTTTAAADRGHRQPAHAAAMRSEPPQERAAAPDFAPYRRRYLARQQAMEVSIGPLRDRLRATLAARSPDMARLAAVDAVMAQVLEAREHDLLSTVPGLLEKHFQRLRQAAEAAAPGDAPATGAGDAHGGQGTPSGAWLDVFRKDFQDVLLAELDFRFQPVEGLLEALGTRQAITP
jgi:hypothetical protein